MTSALSTDVFISHSSLDKPYADLLSELLDSTIDFAGGEIVSTSTTGFGLTFGEDFEKKLRDCIEATYVVIPIISKNSLASFFCGIEIGAAWGQQKPILPLLLPGFDASLLPRPLSSAHYCAWSNPLSLIQLIEEVSRATKSKIRAKPARISELASRAAKFDAA